MTFPPNGDLVSSPKLRHASVVRKHISQYGTGEIGLRILNKNQLSDVENIRIKVYRQTDVANLEYLENPLGDKIIEAGMPPIVREELGIYSIPLGPAYTDQRGILTAIWEYSLEGKTFTYTDYAQILEQMPLYDALRDSEKYYVEQVSWLFGDLFDSTEGGPWLTENFQTHYTFERIAQLMVRAMAKINLSGAPITNFGIGQGQQFPIEYGGLLVSATYMEVLRHFMRSYVEIPEFKNMDVTYTDRSRYMEKWKSILDEEKENFDLMLKMVKRKLLGLGRGALLVSGGIYGGGGKGGGLYTGSMYTSMVRSMRFYPAAPSIGFPGQSR